MVPESATSNDSSPRRTLYWEKRAWSSGSPSAAWPSPVPLLWALAFPFAFGLGTTFALPFAFDFGLMASFFRGLALGLALAVDLASVDAPDALGVLGPASPGASGARLEWHGTGAQLNEDCL